MTDYVVSLAIAQRNWAYGLATRAIGLPLAPAVGHACVSFCGASICAGPGYCRSLLAGQLSRQAEGGGPCGGAGCTSLTFSAACRSRGPWPVTCVLLALGIRAWRWPAPYDIRHCDELSYIAGKPAPSRRVDSPLQVRTGRPADLAGLDSRGSDCLQGPACPPAGSGPGPLAVSCISCGGRGAVSCLPRRQPAAVCVGGHRHRGRPRSGDRGLPPGALQGGPSGGLSDCRHSCLHATVR